MIGQGIVLLFLALGTLWDLKTKSIPKIYLFIWSLIAAAYLFLRVMNQESELNVVVGIVPGAICLFLAYVTKEQIGFGDGVVILLTGIFLDMKEVVCIVFISFLILTFALIILLIIQRVNRKSKIPFIPFLFVGHVVYVCCGGFV